MIPISRHSLYGFAAILLWSTSIAMARTLAEAVGPFTAGAGVYFVGSAFCLANLSRSGNPLAPLRRLPFRYVAGCGTLFVVYMAAFYLAIGMAHDRRQVLEIGLVNYLWPAMTILLSLLILRKKAGPLIVPGTILAVAGVFLVMTQGGPFSWTGFLENAAGNPLAYSAAFLGAALWGLYSNLVAKWAGAHHESAVTYFMLAAGILLGGLGALMGEPGAWGPRSVVEVFFLGLATGLGYELWDAAMREGDVVLVAAVSYSTPLLSTVFSCVYLGVWPGLNLWMGCLLIMAGSFASWKSVR